MPGVASFWISAVVVGYTYVGFPLLLLVRAVVRPRPWIHSPVERPSVTVVIAAHDEEAVIDVKVRNVLDQDYPADRLDCVVASDGSTDATVACARRITDERVTVLDLPRSGKAAVLNTAVGYASGEVVVFTDANSMLAPDAVAMIVEPFADPQVGGVAGDQRYDAGVDAAGERTYWTFDRLLKEAGSRAGNVVSATGSLYAVRRDLIRLVPPGVTDDFAMSTAVIEQGRRLVFEPRAVAHESPAAGLGAEYARKVRVTTRGLRAVLLRRSLLDPRRSGFYAVQLVSHKILRRLVVVPIAVMGASGWRLRKCHRLYGAAASGHIAIHLLGSAGLLAAKTRVGRSRVLALPAYFVMVNAAALHAVWNLATGRRIEQWRPRRRGSQDGGPRP